jgi:hypothetical protein
MTVEYFNQSTQNWMTLFGCRTERGKQFSNASPYKKRATVFQYLRVSLPCLLQACLLRRKAPVMEYRYSPASE